MSPSEAPHESSPESAARKAQSDAQASRANAPDAEALESNALEFVLTRGSRAASGKANEIAERSERGADGEASTKSQKTRAGDGTKSNDLVPDSVSERFIKVGNHFYFPDGAPAFTDHGNRLTTRSENTVVIQSLVAIAQARAKGAVTVKGTEFFRKEAWFAAQLAGLEVKGYEPTPLEQERLVRSLARRRELAQEDRPMIEPQGGTVREKRSDTVTPTRADPADPPSRAQAHDRELIVGRLVDHGSAPFDRNDKNAMNYYVRVETEHGDVERWGVDLERAFRQSLSRPGIGDEVGLRVVGRDPVTVRAAKYDAQGREIGHEEVETHRNQWIVERKDFLDRRAQMAALFRDPQVPAAEATQRYPELEGSYLQFQMGRALAEQQYSRPQHREQFVDHMREYLAKIIEQGRPLEPVPLRERTDNVLQPEPVKDRDHHPAR